MKKISPFVLLILFLLSGSIFSQSNETIKVITMEDAVNMAVERSDEYKAFASKKEAEKKLIKSAFNLRSPSLSLETGQINSELRDYKLLISQEIDFPMVYAGQISAQKARSRSTDHLVEWNKQEMIAEIRSTYMNWWISAFRQKLLKRQDSLFQLFSQGIARQYELGDADRLMLVVAEAKLARIENRYQMVSTEYSVHQNDLKTMIHSKGEIALPEIEPVKMPLVISNDFSPGNTQLSKHLENEVKFSEAIYHTESWRLFPSFEIGWFTQSLDEAKPFTGWQYGISFPIWLWEPVGKIQNARINRDIAVFQKENTLHHLSARYFQLIREFETSQKHLAYYENNGLLHSQSIIKTGKISYDKGQIDLFEFIMLVSNAFEIQEEYLDALNKYNQSVIQINKLSGK